jgi:hypothetical protein
VIADNMTLGGLAASCAMRGNKDSAQEPGGSAPRT